MKVFFRQRRFMKGDKAGEPLTTGWLPPLPDMRDYSNEHPVISKLSMKLGINGLNKTEIESSLPGRVDLREWCSPVEDQLSLGSCTANAVVGMVEYFQKRAYGTHIEGSRLFVYKTTRKLILNRGFRSLAPFGNGCSRIIRGP